LEFLCLPPGWARQMACPPFLISANASGWNPLAGCAARTINIAPGVALRKRPRVATAPVPNVAQDASGCRLHNDGMARGRPCALPQFPDPGQRLKPGPEIGWRIRERHFAISGCAATQQGMAPQQRRGPAAGGRQRRTQAERTCAAATYLPPPGPQAVHAAARWLELARNAGPVQPHRHSRVQGCSQPRSSGH